MKNDLTRIIDFFGKEKQSWKFMEESGELITAFCKFKLNPTEDNKKALTAEIADKLLMIEQICIMYNIHQNEIDDIKRYKVDRTLKILKPSWDL